MDIDMDVDQYIGPTFGYWEPQGSGLLTWAPTPHGGHVCVDADLSAAA